MHTRYLSEGDLLRLQNKRGRTLFALYGNFSFHTLYISILSHKINLNAKPLPNHHAHFQLFKKWGMCATWTQQDLSIALPQLPGSTLGLGGPRDGSVAQCWCCCQPPSAHPLCFPENKTVDCSAEYKTDNPVILNSKVTGCYFNEVCHCQG